ncbi:MAG: ATP-binding protein [Bacillota bacterium]
MAVASGKGGTGKTTVSANLASVAAEAGIKVIYADCDVEEPNGHLFLRPALRRRRQVTVPVPSVDYEKCMACGACGDICQFSAIICVHKNVLTFDQMCHGCGGCILVCPAGAITEKEREIGTVEEGEAGRVGFVHGRLNIGEAMSPPLIKAVRGAAGNGALVFLDAPPGTSCPVIASIKGADFVLLVTEPTPFGINDLDLAIDMVRELGIPHAVVVNRAVPGNNLARDFCREKGLRILAEIPEDRRVAEAYSGGELAFSAVPGFRDFFMDLLNLVEKEARP